MKKIILPLLIFITFIGKGQNLIPNPGFEKYSLCPTSYNQLSYCTSWSSYSETPDYFNTCSPSQNYCPPNCYAGFQYPHSGNAYAGFYTFVKSVPNNREILGVPLLSTLIIGEKYFISFFINLGGNISPFGLTIGTNKIGVKFSTISYSYIHPTPINNFAHFFCNTIITDTLNWVKISGSFITDSAYNYIIIGNFFTDSLTDTVNIANTGNLYAYYFIDDVCVSTDSLYCADWLGVNENSANNKEAISIYPNPANNLLNVESYNELSGILTIYNILGNPVKSLSVSGSKITIPVEDLPSGLYILKINDNKIRFTIVK